MLKKILALFAVNCGVAVCAWAGEGSVVDTCFQFQTNGNDCYDDDSMIEEGECYALVWRHNDLANYISGLFDNTGAPVNPDMCEILGVFNTAVREEIDGERYACATNSWMILPKGHYSSHSLNGIYSVFVFDTRTKNGDKWILGGKTSDKTVASLRRYGLVTDLDDIKLGSGYNDEETGKGTFFSYNTGIYGTDFVENEDPLSWGDDSDLYSCADTPVIDLFEIQTKEFVTVASVKVDGQVVSAQYRGTDGKSLVVTYKTVAGKLFANGSDTYVYEGVVAPGVIDTGIAKQEVVDEAKPVPPGEDVDVPSGKTVGQFVDDINTNGAVKAKYLKAPGGVETTPAYLSYFGAVPAGGNKVAFALNAAGTNAVVTAQDEAKEAVLASVLAATGSGELSIAEPIKGFYYCLVQQEELTGEAKPSVDEKLAGRDEVTFGLTKWTKSGFYQMRVSPKPVAGDVGSLGGQ